jgi:16S rRNA (cytidine1402-2'-O)-methyltransferase
MIAALSVAGLATDRFCFEGFLPAKKKGRRDALAELAHETRTMVFYESVHRMEDSVADMVDVFGGTRSVFLGREISKMHEQCISTTLGELSRQVMNNEITQKGELVIVVAGGDHVTSSSIDSDKLLSELAAILPKKEAARIVASATGEKRNALYQRLLDMASSADTD